MSGFITFAALAHPRRGNMLLGAAALFAAGLTAGALVNPITEPKLRPFLRSIALPQRVLVAPSGFSRRSYGQVSVNAQPVRGLDPGLAYQADVVRVIDGDTFVARVRVRQGFYVNTHIRLRDIDAAELHARCGDELAKAEAARTALQTILAQGDVRLSQVGIDKYGGRVDAAVATRTTADVSSALLNGGFARAYGGGKRGSWCG